MRSILFGMPIAKLQPKQIERATGTIFHAPIACRFFLSYVTRDSYGSSAARVSATSGDPCSQYDRSLSRHLPSLWSMHGGEQ